MIYWFINLDFWWPERVASKICARVSGNDDSTGLKVENLLHQFWKLTTKNPNLFLFSFGINPKFGSRKGMASLRWDEGWSGTYSHLNLWNGTVSPRHIKNDQLQWTWTTAATAITSIESSCGHIISSVCEAHFSTCKFKYFETNIHGFELIGNCTFNWFK